MAKNTLDRRESSPPEDERLSPNERQNLDELRNPKNAKETNERVQARLDEHLQQLQDVFKGADAVSRTRDRDVERFQEWMEKTQGGRLKRWGLGAAARFEKMRPADAAYARSEWDKCSGTDESIARGRTQQALSDRFDAAELMDRAAELAERRSTLDARKGALLTRQQELSQDLMHTRSLDNQRARDSADRSIPRDRKEERSSASYHRKWLDEDLARIDAPPGFSVSTGTESLENRKRVRGYLAYQREQLERDARKRKEFDSLTKPGMVRTGRLVELRAEQKRSKAVEHDLYQVRVELLDVLGALNELPGSKRDQLLEEQAVAADPSLVGHLPHEEAPDVQLRRERWETDARAEQERRWEEEARVAERESGGEAAA